MGLASPEGQGKGKEVRGGAGRCRGRLVLEKGKEKRGRGQGCFQAASRCPGPGGEQGARGGGLSYVAAAVAGERRRGEDWPEPSMHRVVDCMQQGWCV